MRKQNKAGFVILSLIFFAGNAFLFFSCAREQHFDISRFISPDTCGACHSEIYSEWQNSMHHLSHQDSLYKKVALYLRTGLTSPDEIKEAESCVKCHTPVGFVSGYPLKLSDPEDKIPEIAREGIQCDYCHSAVSAKKMYNNGLVLSPGKGEEEPGIKRGPFRDSESDFHGSAYSEFHTQSGICGTCHNVRHVVYGTVLESTYDEWKKSPYGAEGGSRIECQDCHMRQKPGVPATASTPRPDNPGTASDGGPERAHIFTHYFIGGNTLIPGTHGDTQKNSMAEERLKNAAELEIDFSAKKDGFVIIRVKNTGAGHYLPTGLTDTRQMWLQFEVLDGKNKVLVSSGFPDALGYLNEDTIIYNTVFGDGSGVPVGNIAKAREILRDRRVPPLSHLEERIKLPAEISKVKVKARLLYRLASQEVVDKVLGRGKLVLPVVEMTAAEAESGK